MMNQSSNSEMPTHREEGFSGARTPNDEISIVDLAGILLTRWKTVVLVTLIAVIVAVALAFLLPRQYVYTTLYSVAEQAPTENNPRGNVEPPETVASRAKNAYLVDVVNATLPPGQELKIDIDIDGSGTDTVMLTSEAVTDEQNLVKRLHQGIAERMLASQQERLQRRRQSLQSQIETLRQTLSGATSAEEGDATFRYATLLAEAERELAMLIDGNVVQVAQRGLKTTSLGTVPIIILGGVVGFILGVMLALLMAFMSAVRRSLQTERQQP